MAKTSGFEFPRSIDPSLIEEGDTIKVTFPKTGGLEITYTGTVHRRSDHGRTRILYTAEGTPILSWEPKGNKKVHVLLLHRAEKAQEVLDFFAMETPERLAS